jgi:fibronectin type 3 domain-containing protein
MLRQSVFVSCVANLYGQALAGRGASSPTVTLTWAVQANATSYAVYRSSTKAGTASQVGTSSVTNFVDKTAGLVNTDTYYYTVQPLNSNATSICSSNQEAVTIP